MLQLRDNGSSNMVEVNSDPCANGISVENFFMNEITDDIMGNKKCQLIPAYKLHKVIGYSLVKDKENVAVSIRPGTKQKRSINANPASNKTNRQVLQVKSNNILSKTSTRQQKRKRSLNSEPENENSQPSKIRKLKAGKTDTEVIHKNGPNAGRRKEDKNEDTKSLVNKHSQRASSKNAGNTHQEILKSPERCRKRGCKPKAVNRENSDHPKVVEERNKMLRVIDENCNLSMSLRPRQSKPHLWRVSCTDSEDESWSHSFEKKGKKKTKRGGEKLAKETAKERKPAKNQCSSKANKDIKSNDKVRMEQTGKRTSKPKKNKENLQEKKIHGAQHKSVQKKEVHKKPEDCEITAKRGTLKYLKQREEYVRALAKEAECEDDFFAEKDLDKQMQIGKLLSLNNFSSLTIKTPNSKGNSPDDGALTPRTNLLGQWGVNKECFLAYTPPAQSPEVLDETEKEGVIETIFHQLRDQKKRSHVKKSAEKKPYESVLMNPQKTSALELPELPTDPDLDKDDSGSDDYFEVSECY